MTWLDQRLARSAQLDRLTYLQQEWRGEAESWWISTDPSQRLGLGGRGRSGKKLRRTRAGFLIRNGSYAVKARSCLRGELCLRVSRSDNPSAAGRDGQAGPDSPALLRYTAYRLNTQFVCVRLFVYTVYACVSVWGQTAQLASLFHALVPCKWSFTACNNIISQTRLAKWRQQNKTWTPRRTRGFRLLFSEHVKLI